MFLTLKNIAWYWPKKKKTIKTKRCKHHCSSIKFYCWKDKSHYLYNLKERLRLILKSLIHYFFVQITTVRWEGKPRTNKEVNRTGIEFKILFPMIRHAYRGTDQEILTILLNFWSPRLQKFHCTIFFQYKVIFFIAL